MARRTKSPEYIQIGENIKKYREEQGLSRDELAERLDLSGSYWADVERGTVGFTLETLKVLCDILKVPADAILYSETAGIDSLLRGEDAETIEIIRNMVVQQLKLLHK